MIKNEINTEYGKLILHPSGCVEIDTIILIEDIPREYVIATADYSPIFDRFTWIGNFIYRYETVIDIDSN